MLCFTSLKAVPGCADTRLWRNVFHIIMAAPDTARWFATGTRECALPLFGACADHDYKNRPHAISFARKSHPPRGSPTLRALFFTLAGVCVCVKGNRARGNFAPECAPAIGSIVVGISSDRRPHVDKCKCVCVCIVPRCAFPAHKTLAARASAENRAGSLLPPAAPVAGTRPGTEPGAHARHAKTGN